MRYRLNHNGLSAMPKKEKIADTVCLVTLKFYIGHN
jgi:hypothetical protein